MESENKITHLYRYYEKHFVDGEGYYITTYVLYEKYEVISETPKGFWIKDSRAFYKKRFVLADSSGKRFAYIKQEDALTGFIYRKKRHLKILKGQAKRVESALNKGNEILQGLKENKEVDNNLFPVKF